MSRLSAIIICLALVCSVYGFQKSTTTSYQPGSTVDLDCGSKRLIVDMAVLFLDGECAGNDGDLRSQIADYCKDNGSSNSCSFTLADVLGSEPDSCITEFEVGKICV
ncbi:uncharacterized protein [Asterias amurensis]|uniref:uncharacterized protein n=1 Tax=Asterias amurensis TaxID=7602 RepID=UPI003AB32537